MLTALGLMSGTSGDGIDAALLETDGLTIHCFGPTHFMPYPEEIKKAILDSYGRIPGPEIKSLERTITELHGEVVEAMIQKAGVRPDLIGFHGQTLYHSPPETHIIGDGHLLARLTRLPVIDQFRLNDIAHGGQGAPFVPLFHQALAMDLPKPLAIINIGGVANVTWIGEEDLPTEILNQVQDDSVGHCRFPHCHPGLDPGSIMTNLLAFDTGPGNGLIDDWVRENTGACWDEGGKIAARGRIDEKLIERWLSHPYFAKLPPKSLDRQTFKVFVDDVRALPFEDGVATLTALTAGSIEKAFTHFPAKPTACFVAGGGAHNATLMKMMSDRLNIPVQNGCDQGWDGDSLEAQAFAFLAVRSLKMLPLSLTGTTGVPHPLSGGRLCSYE